LATQALIKTRSNAKYYSPHEDNQEDNHGDDGTGRDELGLVRAICVKVCHVITLKLGSFHKRIPGPVIFSTKRTFQKFARRKEASCLPAFA